MTDMGDGFAGRRVLTLLVVLAAAGMSLCAQHRVPWPDPAGAEVRRVMHDWPAFRIDVNTATAGELRALPGIGVTLAERIVDDRVARGPFTALDELTRVHRVGPAIVERVRPYAAASAGSLER